MWNISKEVKEKFVKCHLLPIHESDEDWEHSLREANEENDNLFARLEEDLIEVKEELLQVLPIRFIPYVENGSLNQPSLPKSVREDYLQWIREASKEFEEVLDSAAQQTNQAAALLPDAVRDVFAESLHDSTIERIDRKDDSLHLYLNTDGGFTSKAHIHLVFQNILTEESETPVRVGHWVVYYELQKTNDGFAFRVLFDFPDAEWTITMKSLNAEYFYRPAAYPLLRDEGKLKEASLADYIEKLNLDYRYWLITPDITCPIHSFSETIVLENGKVDFANNEMVVTVDNQRFVYTLKEFNPLQFIYTDVYEDPYAQFSIPVPSDEIETAVCSNDLELQVRAWNTLYANPIELADMINSVLSKITITEENEMMISVIVGHFYKSGILSEAVIERHRALIDE